MMSNPTRVYQDIDIRTRNGQFFRVDFIKKNGDLREMHARRFVDKWDGPTTGEPREWNPEEKDLLQVWDVEKEAYRFINLRTVQLVRAGGDEIRYDV